MRKVILSVNISLDGYFEAEGEGLQKISWFRADNEWIDYSIELLSGTGDLLFGRRTYEGFAAFWPYQHGPLSDLLNAVPKTVFSRTLTNAEWKGTRVSPEAATEVRRLKTEPGRDIVIFASADLVSTLLPLGLIDEYRLAINPVVIGGGTPMFKPGARLDLDRFDVRLFGSGIIELRGTPRTGDAS